MPLLSRCCACAVALLGSVVVVAASSCQGRVTRCHDRACRVLPTSSPAHRTLRPSFTWQCGLGAAARCASPLPAIIYVAVWVGSCRTLCVAIAAPSVCATPTPLSQSCRSLVVTRWLGLESWALKAGWAYILRMPHASERNHIFEEIK
jgi:hypothetical protein